MGYRWKGAVFLAAGHHATEEYCVQGLGEYLAARFGQQHSSVDIPNPVCGGFLARFEPALFSSFISAS